MFSEGFTIGNIYQTEIVTAIKSRVRGGRHRRGEDYMQKFIRETLMQGMAWETEALGC